MQHGSSVRSASTSSGGSCPLHRQSDADPLSSSAESHDSHHQPGPWTQRRKQTTKSAVNQSTILMGNARVPYPVAKENVEKRVRSEAPDRIIRIRAVHVHPIHP